MNKLKGTIGKTPKLSGEIKAQIVTVGTGEDGATFIPTVSENGIISWTNDKGLENPQPVNIKGPQGETGSKGDTGDAGKDGYTPIKGTDYFTEADKAEIVEETVENIPTASADTKGLVKVGDGLTMADGVLSVEPEGEYELLEKSTLTADVKVLDRSKSSDGTPYNLKALKILVTSPIGSTVATLYLKVFDNVEDEYNNFMLELGTSSYAATNNPSTAIFQIIPFAKQYISIASSGSYNNAQAVFQPKNLYGCTASTDTPIKRFRLNRHDYTNMLSGTVIEIWGVKA